MASRALRGMSSKCSVLRFGQMKVLLPFSLPFLRLFAKFPVAAVECDHEFVDFFFGGEVRKAYAPGVQGVFAVAADGKHGAGGERIYAAGGLDRHINSFVRKSFLENVPADSRDTQVQNVRDGACGRIDADFRIAAEFFLQNRSQFLDAGKSLFEMLHGKRQCRFEGCVQCERRGSAAVNGGTGTAVNERLHGDSAFFVQKPAARKPVELVRADACRVCQIQVYGRFPDGLRSIHMKATVREFAYNITDGFQRLHRPEFAIHRVHRHEHRIFA